MPCNGLLMTSREYKPGDPAPSGYLDWFEWAEVQHMAGLSQVACGTCGKWKFPQELSAEVTGDSLLDAAGCAVTLPRAVCLKCASH